MCLLNRTPQYITIFLLIMTKDIFGIYGSSGPPSNSLQSLSSYHSHQIDGAAVKTATTTTPLAIDLGTAAASMMASSLATPAAVDLATAAAASASAATNTTTESSWLEFLFVLFKASIMISIIVAAVFGNLLVIISVMRNRKLR